MKNYYTSLVVLICFCMQSMLWSQAPNPKINLDPTHYHCHACSAAKTLASQTWNNQSFSHNYNSRNDSFQIQDYHIHIQETNVNTKFIKANTILKVQALLDNLNTLTLDLLGLSVDSIKQIENNTLLTFVQNDSMVLVQLPNPTTSQAIQHIQVFYKGNMRSDNLWGGAYANAPYLYTIGVGFAANPHNFGRVWYPCFDNFRNRATYTIVINSQGTKVGHANGLLINEAINGNDITRTWRINTPIPTYLSAFAIADYATVRQTYESVFTGIHTPIELVALPVDTTNFKNAFANLNTAIEAYEYWFGPYNWEKVGYTIVPFSAGAMEHATNIAYPKYAINGGTLNEERLMAHELSHHWWGNWLTCETAEDMWINEGMAAYCEHLFLEYKYGLLAYKNAVKNNHYTTLTGAHTAEGGYRAVSGVPHEYTYGRHVYDKGATVAHNLRWYMTDSLFRLGMRQLMQNNALATLNSEQMRDSLMAYTSVDLRDFFNDWVFGAGYPHFEIAAYTQSVNNANYDLNIQIEQKVVGRNNYFMQVPIMISVYGAQAGEFYTQRVMANGQFYTVQLNIPFEAKHIFINEQEELAQSRYDLDMKIAGTPSNLNLNAVRIAALSIGENTSNDSLRLLAHYHPVAPSTGNNPNNYILSNQRFWSLHLFDNGATSNNTLRWMLDNTLDADVLSGGADSLVLLYRPNPNENWVEHPNYTKSSPAGVHIVRVNTFLNGDYAFAKGQVGLGLQPQESAKYLKKIQLYPNPVTDNLILELHLQKRRDLQIIIVDTLGRVRASLSWDEVQGKVQKEIPLGDLESGIYFLKLQESTGKLLQTEKFHKQ